MGSRDDLTKRARVVSWTFVDFLEGLCRLAEALSLPSEWELERAAAVHQAMLGSKPDSRAASGGSTAAFQCKATSYWSYITLMSIPYLKANRRPSFGVIHTEGNASERGLHEKVDALLHLMIAGLCQVWAVRTVNEKALTRKLKQKAAALGLSSMEDA